MLQNDLIYKKYKKKVKNSGTPLVIHINKGAITIKKLVQMDWESLRKRLFFINLSNAKKNTSDFLN